MGFRNPYRLLDAYRAGLMAAVLGRHGNGRVVHKPGVMWVLEAGGDVSAGDHFTVELPPESGEALESV
jgi:hypothetical protein